MATAARIAKPLGINEVTVSYVASEHQPTHLFPANPLPHLDFKNRPLAELNEEYKLLDVDFKDTEDFWTEINTVYPEPDDCLVRNRLLVERQRDAFKAQQAGSTVLHIIVCHGFFLDRFSRIVADKGLEEIKDPKNWGKYCGISAAKFTEGKEEVLCSADSTHVITKSK